MANTTANTSGGIGLTGILTIIFVLAKLFGAISWSWWWVFSPLWISAGIAITFFVIFFLFAIIVAALK